MVAVAAAAVVDGSDPAGRGKGEVVERVGAVVVVEEDDEGPLEPPGLIRPVDESTS